jgi:methylphosphotriester-DNA--protein-cysteine methyltransferase
LRSTGGTPDNRITTTLDTIYHQHGQLRFDDAAVHAVNPRELRRLFDRHIGISPKSFARIVRFQSMLQTMLRDPEREWGQRCLDFGYYDQAHFIHDFKRHFAIVDPNGIGVDIVTYTPPADTEQT